MLNAGQELEEESQQTLAIPQTNREASRPPEANLLSNGRLSSRTAAGGSSIVFEGLSVNRWYPDRSFHHGGYLMYIRDLESGEFWSATGRPARYEAADSFSVRFSAGSTRFERLQDGLHATVDVWVSDEDAEIRRLTVYNRSGRRRRLEVTSYLEIVLNSRVADRGHPAFSKLFVQTSYDERSGTIRAWRRPRSPDEAPILFIHGMAGAGNASGYETSRAAFIGRGRDTSDPLAMRIPAMQGRVGSVLDPVASLRRAFTLEPNKSASIVLYTGAARSEDGIEAIASRFAGHRFGVEDDLRSARARESRLLKEHGFSGGRAESLRRLTAALFEHVPQWRAPVESRIEASPIERLATYDIDARTPLIMLEAEPGFVDGSFIHDVPRAMAYWRQQGLETQLLALTDGDGAWLDQLRAHAAGGDGTSRSQAVTILPRSEVPESDRALIRSTAAVYLDGRVLEPGRASATSPGDRIFATRASGTQHGSRIDPEDLQFYNEYGGFTRDGAEYVVDVRADGEGGHVLPPHPWANVIANENIGFLITERGSSSTWATNSRENRLTPWYNDPVSDPTGEALFIRDEDCGEYWSVTPGPCPSPAPYAVRHGLGYTAVESAWAEISHVTTYFVDRDRPLKMARVELENRSDRARTISLFSYHHLVLGPDEEVTSSNVSIEWDDRRECALARNRTNNEFRDQIVVVAARAEEGDTFHTLHREAFLGDGGSLARPRALECERELDGARGDGAVPTVGIQLRLTIPPGGRTKADVLLGVVEEEDQIDPLLNLEQGGAAAILERSKRFWTDLTGRIQIQTPAPEIDLMVNRWLPYQNLSCRILGRTAFYQSGGAFGFRDQLQDAAAMAYLDPSLARRQIVLHAEHQFAEGDVLHWWHPPTSKGIRTRFSDDLLWLPYVTAFFARMTGDTSVLDEEARYLSARQLEPGEDEAFVYPQESGESGSVYDHCCRALDRSLTRGRNGLPLMGTGDWNDGMNRVGREGQGESAWLGFFILHILNRFIPICEARRDATRVARYRKYREQLIDALNDAGWDGEWYRRAFYDNGNVMGSRESDECRIDALAQAWAVISGAAPPERAARALDAMERYLVDEEAGIIRLLTPAFDRTPDDPGYIKGYVPGVRENGGQYTHGVLWAIRALAEVGRGDRAAMLLAMLSPIRHALTKEDADRYHVEPYVIAADVYGEPPHVGRGGWTWYTGSAGWMYRVVLESVLGIRIENGTHLTVNPSIPPDWSGFTVTYRVPGVETTYILRVRNQIGRTEGVRGARWAEGDLDIAEGAARIPLRSDGGRHEVVIDM